MKIGIIMAVLFIVLATTGSQCINDNFLMSVNIQGVTGTYKINTGNGQFNDCTTISSSNYLDQSFSIADSVRIYDIQVSTIGTYGGNVNGTATVNGSPILSFNGSFTYFNTPRSLLTDPNITRIPGGIVTLINTVKRQQPITICGVGLASPASPT